MPRRATTIYLDGQLVKADRDLMDALTPGCVARRGVFETMRTYQRAVFAWSEHLARMERGMRRLNIRPPCTRRQWHSHLQGLLRINQLTQARVRLAVWDDDKRSRAAIVVQPLKAYPGSQYRRGFHAIVSGIRRNRTRHSHIKSLDYGPFRRAFLEAKKQKRDEAILLNNRNELTEASRSNLFYVKRGDLHTPAVSCGCLNGITRQVVICLARQAGIPCKTVRAGLRRLTGADEAFLTNSLIGIMPLTAVGSGRIANGRPGTVTQKLRRSYQTFVHSSCPATGKSV